uniref:GCK domain-containing protein n=1 Tax=Peronospora matthiolae TaxID=2874970 RepID=A0AAV1TX05_9STRA
MVHSFLRSRRLLSSLVAPAALLATSPARLEADKEEERQQQERGAPPAVDLIGVFVQSESAARLRERFPRTCDCKDTPLVVVLRYQPTVEEQEAFAPILGTKAKLQVQGVVEDPYAQTLLVAVTTEAGDSLEYEGAAEPAHLTLSTPIDALGASGYSSVLLERLRASDKLQYLLNKDETVTQWTGTLPEFISKHLPLYGSFPAVEASVKKLDTELTLEGTVCLLSSFDAATGTCLAPKAECGFCKFMKAGPCGREFVAWESCLDQCKKSGEDFIETCGPQTLGLRDCVDAHPEYYHVLTDDGPEDENEQEEMMATKKKMEQENEATATKNEQ